MATMPTWVRSVGMPEVHTQLEDLQSSVLRVVLALATAGYFLWHVANTALLGVDQMVRAFGVAAVVLPVLGLAWALLPRNLPAASLVAVGGALAAITCALLVMADPRAALLYPVVALVAAFVVHPLVGAAVLAAALASMAAVAGWRPGIVQAEDLWTVGAIGLLGLAAVWTLFHHVLLVLTWYADSYASAERRAREAEGHRAELVQTSRQLDVAYRQLQHATEESARSRKAAVEALELKAHFAAAISHELRTPLNLIVGFTEMMMSSPRAYDGQPLSPAYRAHLEVVYRNARGLSQLVDDILDLSQVEAHRLALERSAVELPEVVDEAVATVAPLFEHLGLEVTVEMPPDLPRLFADAKRVKQILINLLNNAARFTEQGGVSVRAIHDDREVVVEVADTGVGIAPEDLPHVFDAFQQVGPTDRRRHGSGLGLTICKEFAEMHGGYMRVESELGRGTTFYVALPLTSNVTTMPGRREHPPPSAGEHVVVVVDPEQATSRLHARYLDGYKVVAAATLEDARGLVDEWSPLGIVLADPELAPAWHRHAADDPRLRELPTFTCTLRTPQAIVRELGVAEYLVKPVERADLTAALRRVAGKKRDVLIVEDDPEMAALLAKMLRLESRRYRIRHASDGRAAIATLRERPADVVLLDLLLPKANGHEVLRQLQAEAAMRDIPVIVVSGGGTHDERVRSSALGISRPDGLTVGEMARCLRAALDVLVGAQHPPPLPVRPEAAAA